MYPLINILPSRLPFMALCLLGSLCYPLQTKAMEQEETAREAFILTEHASNSHRALY